MAERKQREGKKTRGITKTFRMNEVLYDQCSKLVELENEMGFNGFYSMSDFIHEAMKEALFDKAVEEYATCVLYGKAFISTRKTDKGEIEAVEASNELRDRITEMAREAYKVKFREVLIDNNIMDDINFIDSQLSYFAERKMKEIIISAGGTDE